MAASFRIPKRDCARFRASATIRRLRSPRSPSTVLRLSWTAMSRVISRLFAIEAPLPGSKPQMKAKVAELTPTDRPGDFAQAMMWIWVRRSARRSARPARSVQRRVSGARNRRAGAFPGQGGEEGKAGRCGWGRLHCGGSRRAASVAQRVESGLLGGMTEVPTTGLDLAAGRETGVEAAPSRRWQAAGAIAHVFTHFELRAVVSTDARRPIDRPAGDHGFWAPVTELDGEALPTVMKKAIAAAIPTAFQHSRANT